MDLAFTWLSMVIDYISQHHNNLLMKMITFDNTTCYKDNQQQCIGGKLFI